MLFCLLMASTLAVKAQTKPSLGTFIIPTDKNIQYIGRIEDKEGLLETDEDPFSPLND